MLRFTLFLFFGIHLNTFSQEIDFPTDDTGKYTFIEVVELTGMKKDLLFENGKKFMKKIKVLNSKTGYLRVDNENYEIYNRGSFYVYRIGSVKKGIGGAVEYDIKLEFKDDKYRYTIANFMFNEYRKNRYGKFEPVNGKYTPLEKEVSTLNKKEWDKHRAVIYEKTRELIRNLYGQMIYEEEKKNKKVKTIEEW
ncbi:MAG: DUF4468 domain-containing protein [Cytophagales bacterium]|nr:DUF4468 domain-containing protein [Cytophagales bacterium]